MITLEALRAYGANVDEGLARCVKNEGLYLRLVGTLVKEPRFDELKQALESGDLTGAYEAAHALKGSLANLSLTPLSEPMAQLSDTLKARLQGVLPEGGEPDFGALLEKCVKAKEAFDAMAAE